MQPTGSVTNWIRQLKGGDAAAIQRLWEGYFRRLVRLARRKLTAARPRGADEEDVALSAFHSFLRGAQTGRFPQLSDRDDLWQVLVILAQRKAINLIRHERRRKRGGGWTQKELRPTDDSAVYGPAFADLISREPDPGSVVRIAEQFRRLLNKLADPDLRSIAMWKMEGYTNTEIAHRLQRSMATVERKLRLIRKVWQSEVSS